jgi:hypothetical protein
LSYLLIERFRSLFADVRYRHRDSSLGDSVAWCLPEDLYGLGRSLKFNGRVEARRDVLNVKNQLRGIKSRRGDGTFGELVPGAPTFVVPGFVVARGQIATVEIGVEVKVLAKAMIKQIDRVITVLRNQSDEFKKGGGNPVSVGIVGINQSDTYVSYEGEVEWPTGLRGNKHPIEEAAEAERRVVSRAASAFDEFLVLRFRAWNKPPYRFEWVAESQTELDYGAMLTRILRKYDARF